MVSFTSSPRNGTKFVAQCLQKKYMSFLSPETRTAILPGDEAGFEDECVGLRDVVGQRRISEEQGRTTREPGSRVKEMERSGPEMCINEQAEASDKNSCEHSCSVSVCLGILLSVEHR